MSYDQECTSVMFVGVGKSHIASRYFLHGMLVEVSLKPANSTVPKYKFVRVEDDSIVAIDAKPLNCLEETW